MIANGQPFLLQTRHVFEIVGPLGDDFPLFGGGKDHFDALIHKIAPNARIGRLPEPVAEFAARTALASLRTTVKRAGG